MRKPFDILEYKQPTWLQKLDDLSGFRYEKSLMKAICQYSDLDGYFYIPCSKVFLISGPEGYGKHTLAKAFSNELCQNGYEFFLIDGELLMEEEDVVEIIRALFEDIIRSTIPDEETEFYRGYYILFDHFDALCGEKEICDLFARFFEMIDFDVTDYDCKCIMSCIAEDMNDIPIKVRKYMNIFELELPDEEDRKEFFGKEFLVYKDPDNLQEEMIPVEADYPANSLAEITDHFTYGELRKLVLQGKLYYKAKVGTMFVDLMKPYKENGKFLTMDEVKVIVSHIRRGKRKPVPKDNNMQSHGTQMPPIIINGVTGAVGNQSVAGMGTYQGSYHEDYQGDLSAAEKKDFVDLRLFDSINEEEEYEQYSNRM